MPLRTTPLVFSAPKSKSKVAVGVSYVFLLCEMANPASFLVLVCRKLVCDDIVFHMHLCHVTLDCPKPKHV